MKANRKFLNEDDDAVSPVIAVILMVAITVVLAATVYVWVSGFGSQSGNPSKSLSLSSNGPLSANGWKNFTIASASSGMRYSDLTVTVNGVSFALAEAADTPAADCSPIAYDDAKYLACQGATVRLADDVVAAGDILSLQTLSSGDTLRILDASANSVMLTLTIG